jgi:hypothetical protein
MRAGVYTRYFDYHCYAAMFSLFFVFFVLYMLFFAGHKSARKPLGVIISVSSLQD